jgi:hypothetical protein
MTVTLDEPLWQEAEAPRPTVLAILRDHVRQMRPSPITQRLTAKTPEGKIKALNLLVWHLEGLFA